MNRAIYAALMCGAIWISPSAVSGATTIAIPSAPSSEEACTANRTICIKVVTVPVSGALLQKGYRWGGEDAAPPQFVLSQLNVVANGEEVFLPLSAYVDLGNPRAVEVHLTRRGFDVIVVGGDAAASYRAHLVFEKRSLVRRRVQHGEFPKEAWEETRYRYNTLKN